MSAHAEAPGHGGPPPGYGNVGHLDRVMLGLIVALASEIMLFGAFFTAFFYIRYTNYPVYPARAVRDAGRLDGHQHGDPDLVLVHDALGARLDQARQPPRADARACSSR